MIAELHNHYGNGLLTRFLGVAGIPAQLRHLLEHISEKSQLPVQQACSDGMGLAQVQAGRGLLIHRLGLRQEICARLAHRRAHRIEFS